jgi:CDP-paratose 2-epimerase
MRRQFFGDEASTAWNRLHLEQSIRGYRHHALDIRDGDGINRVFEDYGSDIGIIVHAAAQPSHDWAAREPMTDFTVNALGTLVLLEAMRRYAPDATFIFTSTNKVYGDNPNLLPLVEKGARWEVDPVHPCSAHGIDESMSVDQCKHSLFGASKLAADALVQEYGRYFGMNTGVFRGGCLTGGNHAGTELHGFLSYLMRCCVEGRGYKIFGYKGKQVRDNIHAFDLVNMFWHFHENPRPGEVYNAGGSRHSNCSMLEAIEICQRISSRKLHFEYVEQGRIGDHIWYISDVRKFQRHNPNWAYRYDLNDILSEIYDQWRGRTRAAA